MTARRACEAVRKSYQGGKLDRNTKRWLASQESGTSSNLGEIQRCRYRAHDLHRNDTHARKLVRAVIAQVVGCGLKPEPQATKKNGEPDQAFRKLAKELWYLWCKEGVYQPVIGSGGFTFDQLVQMAVREVVLSGEVFVRFHEINDSRRILPFAVELIPCERVIEDATAPSFARPGDGNSVFRGVEFDKDGNRVAYHLWKHHPSDPRPLFTPLESVRVPASEIIHLFIPERPDSIRGVSLFAPLLFMLRDVSDYRENELMAAAIGACVVAAITRNAGAGTFGLATPSGASATDEDGNPITRLQPGMLLDLRAGESITGFNPQRPNSSAEGFITFLLRSVSTGLPGVKSSTVTGDYRASSFSSERSADNDCWRETEQMQEWLASNLCQPVYEKVLASGVEHGWFNEMDFRSFRLNVGEADAGDQQAAANKRRYLAAEWHGPVARSINPADDAQASALLIAQGLSSPQTEAANIGLNAEQALEQQAAFLQKKRDLGLPVPEDMQKEQHAAEMQAAEAQVLAAQSQALAAEQAAKQPPNGMPRRILNGHARNPFVGPNGEDLSLGAA